MSCAKGNVRCNSDAFRVSETGSEQIEKAPPFYAVVRRQSHSLVDAAGAGVGVGEDKRSARLPARHAPFAVGLHARGSGDWSAAGCRTRYRALGTRDSRHERQSARSDSTKSYPQAQIIFRPSTAQQIQNCLSRSQIRAGGKLPGKARLVIPNGVV